MQPKGEALDEDSGDGSSTHSVVEQVPGGTIPPADADADPSSVDLHELLDALQAMRVGDFSVRLKNHQDGLAGRIADAFNDIAAANQRMAQQLDHVGRGRWP